MSDRLCIQQKNGHFVGRFFAMASDCEILVDTTDELVASQIIERLSAECLRIEAKYSRYRKDNIVYQINHAEGEAVSIDEETYQLLNLAQTCYELSEGYFDITSGILGKVWSFDGSDCLADQNEIDKLLPLVGFEKLQFDQQYIELPAGMALDFGGIGKEYAVDSCANIALTMVPEISVLVNFGGDIAVSRPKLDSAYWQVGVTHPNPQKDAKVLVQIAQGGLATSGDANRFLLKNGVRYSHVLNPQTGQPIIDAPASVTVAGDNCSQAGLLATMALLQGNNAECFLTEQDVKHWCIRL